MTTQEFLDALKALPTKVASMATWKKVLIIISVLIFTHGVVGLGLYIAGVKSLKPYQPPTITLGKPAPKTTIDKNNPLAYTCGDKIDITASFENEKKLKIIGKDTCKQSVYYYDLNYSCPNLKYSIGIAPGFLIGYDTIGKKIYPMVGGELSFQRHWSNFSCGPEVFVYSTIDKSYFAAGANIKFELRFGK